MKLKKYEQSDGGFFFENSTQSADFYNYRYAQ